jgi:hypothetical protein
VAARARIERQRLAAATWLLLAGLVPAARAVKPAVQSDSIPNPPPREEFGAPGGAWRLVIESVDGPGWKARRSRADMQHLDAGAWRTRWQLALPHAYRPRFALALPTGGAVLFDEWIHIRSRLAVVVLDAQGRQLAATPLDTVLQLLGLPAKEVVAAARHGWWMQSAPRLSADGQWAEVQTAGQLLRVRVLDGSLQLG